MNKEKLPILLVVVLMLPLLISYLVFTMYKYHIQKEVKLFLCKTTDIHNFLLLKFSKEEIKTTLKWEHPGEFEYNGQMYDIIQTEERHDSVYYWVWCDTKETELKKQYHILLSEILYNNTQQKENSKKLIDFLKKLYFESNTLKFIISNNVIHIFYPNNIYGKVCLEVSSPPPEV